MDFALQPLRHQQKPLQKYNDSRNHLKQNSKMLQSKQIDFNSYQQSLTYFHQNLTQMQKQKYSQILQGFFYHLNTQITHMKEEAIQKNKRQENIKSEKRKSLKTNQKPNSTVKSLLEIHKIDLQQKHSSFQSAQEEENQEFQVKDFTHQERQSLKNAFRYICRLVFKQSHKYSDQMAKNSFRKSLQKQIPNEIDDTLHNNKRSRRQKSSISQGQNNLSELNLLEEAELISGERYFKQFILKLQINQRITLLNYMIWFLRTKYLRYINKCNNENKGKRKHMKKDLYIRYKNNTMLPYLQALLEKPFIQKDYV